MHGGHLILLSATGRRVSGRDPAHGHLGVTFALWPLHPDKLHVVVFVEAKGHALSHLSRYANLRDRMIGDYDYVNIRCDGTRTRSVP